MLFVCREGSLRFCEEPSAFLTYEDFKTITMFLLNLSAVHMDVLFVVFIEFSMAYKYVNCDVF
jgi:hypothetical protein